jgi:hypothetical protein
MRRFIGMAIVAIACLFAAASADAQTASGPGKFTPGSNKYYGNMKGAYGFSFSGGSAVTNNPDYYSTRASGTGVFYVDGKGNVIGGTVYCSQSTDEEDYAQEWVADIVGGQYIVYSDGTGYMYWRFNNASAAPSAKPSPDNGYDGFCTSNENSIEVSLTLVQGNNQVLFAVDSYDSDSFSYAGHWKNISGVAYRNTVAIGIPK